MKKIIFISIISLFIFSCGKKEDPMPNNVSKNSSQHDTEKDFIKATLSNGEEYIVYGGGGFEIPYSNTDSPTYHGANFTGLTKDGYYITLYFDNVILRDYDSNKVVLNQIYPLFSKKNVIIGALKRLEISKDATSLYNIITTDSISDRYNINKYNHTITKYDMINDDIYKIYGTVNVIFPNNITAKITYKVSLRS